MTRGKVKSKLIYESIMDYPQPSTGLRLYFYLYKNKDKKTGVQFND